MSSYFAHFTVSYTSISSKEQSWSIPTMDPYEEVVLQVREQASPPLSPDYVPEPEDHKEDPTDYPTDREDDKEEEESFRDDADDDDEEEEEECVALTVPTLALLDHVFAFKESDEIDPFEENETSTEALIVAVAVALPSSSPSPSPLTSYSLPLPQIPSLPADVLEAVMPPQKRLLLNAPTPRFEIRESLVAAAS
ncbi:hypothetical protein Tco_0164142 [Tanacetum coccineum]